ncbi:MAG: radical SAM family heme chaperone HemW, partial [Clostridia bacterium]|nr:radical SAM family heme chaperone HemW [Clostridia bacterium]
MSLGIYLHIPFCKQKCLYCDFNSYAGKERMVEEYCHALEQEILSYPAGDAVATIYFGGGTPTVLGAERLAALLGVLKAHFSLAKNCEITAECNPGTIDKAGLSMLYQAGFNRLSIGLQSTDDETLKKLGRIHSYQEFLECFQNAREVGFSNLSLDLMYGLPNQTPEEWKKTLREALRCCPEHLSCYGLKIEEGTPFARMELSLPSDDDVRKMYDDCVEVLQGAGYERYEISNFAKPGLESRHNCRYWRYENFVGFGAGAYSCKEGKRWFNVAGIPDYCRAISQSKSA